MEEGKLTAGEPPPSRGRSVGGRVGVDVIYEWGRVAARSHSQRALVQRTSPAAMDRTDCDNTHDAHERWA